MRKLNIACICSTAIYFFIFAAATAAATTGNVVRVIDGDTLIMLTDGNNQVRVRLSEIDAPEQGQAFGQKSKQALTKLCAGKQAVLRATDKDRYGRTLARVYCNGLDANSEMVKLGMAWVYDRYAKDATLYTYQDAAKAGRAGLWADQNPVQPWVYRSLKKRQFSLFFIAGCVIVMPPKAGARELKCKRFSFSSAAAVYAHKCYRTFNKQKVIDMKKLIAGIALLTFAGAASAQQCEENFTVDGGFLKGKTFKTWAEVEGVNSTDAYSKIYKHIVKDGWKIISSDKDIGVISAGQEVSYGEGKTAPLNVMVEESGDNVKVSLSYSISGGVTAGKGAVVKSFCQTISAVNG